VKVRDVMKLKVVSLPQNSNLGQVVQAFVRHQIDSLPVVDAAERVVGMIIMDDLVDIFLPRYYDLLRDYSALEDKGQLASLFDVSFIGSDKLQSNLILAADIMHTQVHWVSAEAPLLEAAALLQSQHFQRLPVVDRDRKLVGLVSDFEIILSLLHGGPLHHPVPA